VFKAPASMVDASGQIIREPSLMRNLFPELKTTGADVAERLGTNITGDTQMVSARDLAKNTKFGRAYQRAQDQAAFKFRGTNVGQKVDAAVGKGVRAVATQTQQLSHLVGGEIIKGTEAPFFSDPARNAARNTVFDEKFNATLPWLDEYNAFEKAFNDDWAAGYGMKPDEWAVRRTELKNVAEGVPDGKVPGRPVEDFNSLPVHEQEYLEAYRGVTDTMSDKLSAKTLDDPEMPYMQVEIKTPAGKDITETYPYEQGRKILQHRQNVAVGSEMQFVNDVIKDPAFRATVDPQDLMDMSHQSAVLNGPYSKLAKSYVAEGYAHAYLSMGIDVTDFLTRLKQGRYKGGVPDLVLKNAADLTNMLPTAPLLEMADLMDAVRPMRTSRRAPVHPVLGELHTALEAGDIGLARKKFNKVYTKAMNERGVPAEFKALNPVQVDESFKLLQQRAKWQQRPWIVDKSGEMRRGTMGSLDAAKVAKRQKIATKFERSAVPARYVPKMEAMLRDRLVQEADNLTVGMRMSDPARATELLERLGQGELSRLDDIYIETQGLTPEAAAKLRDKFMQKNLNEIKATWQDLYDSGFDPQFVPHVAPGGGGKVQFAQVTVGGKKPRAWNQRMMEFAPSEGDMSLALKHSALEHLLKIGEDHLIDVIQHGSPLEGIRPIVKTRGELETLLKDEIDKRMSRSKGSMDRTTVTNNLIEQYFEKWEAPSQKNFTDMGLYPGGAKSRGRVNMGSSQAADAVYIPKGVGKMFRDMQTAAKPYAIWDPVMGVFRTTTLLLSPRWQIYNILGNSLQATTENGVAWIRHLPEAWKNVKLMRAGEQPSVNLPWNVRASMGQQALEQTKYMDLSAQGLSKVGTSIADRAPQVAELAEKWGKPIGGGISKVADISLRMNAAVDDMTRIAGYMAAADKASAILTPDVMRVLADDGLYVTKTGAVDGAAAAQQLAEQSMRKWAYNWDAMTPWERSVARFVFPFYGFFSHMLRYAYRYAADHPLRVALTSALARTELEDWGTGLPQRIHNMLLVGKEDEQGNRKGINFAGWNPFVDTANLFTLTGWMGQVNPMISTLAEQFGVDPRTGEASLYPTAEFDPKTGRLVLKKRGIVQSFAENVAPQVQAITNLTGNNPDFNELARTNTGAAARLVGSSLGIPTLVRPVNVTQEITKTELARENAARQALSEAVKTGSTGPVRTYPALQQQVNTLLAQREAYPEAFAQYTPPTAQPSVYDLFSRVVRQWSPN